MEIKDFFKSLESETDIDLSVYDPAFLAKTIESRMIKGKARTLEEYMELIGSNQKESQQLFKSFNIHVSSFFRDPLIFALLESILIPQIVQRKLATKHREIRIWSAGCAAGQEAYSLAILLREKLNDYDDHLDFRIFATDSAEDVLTQAKSGVYREKDIANVSQARLNRWFTKRDSNYFINDTLKSKLTFSEQNLLSQDLKSPADSLYGDFDVIFCSNVLLYYNPEIRKEMLNRLNYSLSAKGYLIVDKSEIEIMLVNNYRVAFPHTSIFHLKRNYS